jgi:hypothetical protein
MARWAFISFLLLGLNSTAYPQQAESLAISTQELEARLRFLSSDLFEGRFPGTRGEALTTAYLVSELQSFGLRPGVQQSPGKAASWLQPLSLLLQYPDTTSPVVARVSGRLNQSLEPPREIGALANFTAGQVVSASGELVFVGYGIHAPMYQWDDFAGTDLRGKIAVGLLGEPTLVGDTIRFNGVRASRFGWVIEKIAEMKRRGAIGILWVRPEQSARTSVRRSGRLPEQIRNSELRFMGSIADSTLARLLPSSSPPLAKVLEAAAKPGFRAVPFGLRLDVNFRTRRAIATTNNVIGVVPGSDPRLSGEHVVLTAHWDAYGIGPPVKGDSIYNGALDDGSGMTALLALARVFARQPQARSLTFLFTTSEELGLLGAHAFVCSGLVPPERMAANLNLDDGIELLGVMRDVAPLGIELSTLGRTVARVAARSRLRVSPDPYPEEGFFLRADNYPFARAGVPALYMALGTDAVGASRAFVDEKVKEYLDQHYHQPSDEYDTVVLDLEGSRQFAEFVRNVTIEVANDRRRPEWLPGAEFQRVEGKDAAKQCEG